MATVPSENELKALHALFPQLEEVELVEAANRLHAFLSLAVRIEDRLGSPPNSKPQDSRLTPGTPGLTMNGKESSDEQSHHSP